MKRVLKCLFIVFLLIPCILFAKEKKDLNMYLFYGEGCPHCKALETYLDDYLKDNKNVHLYTYEVWHDDDNVQKLKDVINMLGATQTGIPFLVVGDTYVVGYDENYTPSKIKNVVNYYSEASFKDEVGIYLGVVEDKCEEDDNKKYGDDEIVIPIIGKKSIKDVSIVLCAIVIGLVDGFNPCAMWILLFLISMLLGIEDKKRKCREGTSKKRRRKTPERIR